MAIITDPDNLDRLQVLVDYVGQKIGIKAVNSSSPKVSLHDDLATHSGYTFLTHDGGSYPYAFKDETRDFSSSGVVSGDILTIVEGDNIAHWTVTGLVGTTGLLVASTGGGVGFTQNNSGIGYAVSLPTGGSAADGATLQSVYSFLKEEWKTQGAGYVDLIQFVFPLESITREQFEIGGATHEDWNWRDDDTRNLIRTGGWAAVSSAGQTLQRYAGIITLGTLDADTQVYYLQIDSSSGSPTQPKNFVLTGPVNQAILVSGDGGPDLRNTLKLFARKKGRSYAESTIADIGVTQLETLVNRFPVTHASDPAITATDGELAGTSAYQSTLQLFTGVDGVTSESDSSAQENTFTFTSAGSDFNAYGIEVGDTIHMSGTASGVDNDYFEVVDVVSATELTLLQEPGINIPSESTIDFSANTRIRHPVETNATIQSFGGAISDSGVIDSSTAQFRSSGVVEGDYAYIFASGSEYTSPYVGTYKVINTGVDETEIVVNTIDQPFPTTQSATDFSVEVYRPGMHLQYKSEQATDVPADATSGLVITSASPDTVQRRDGGDFYADNYVTGGILYIGNAEDSANIGSYVISGISTQKENADTISLAQNNTLTSNAADTTATLSGENGFIRAPQTQSYSFNWRLFGNNGTLSQCFQYLQKQLRRGYLTDLYDSSFRRVADINTASGVFRGDITDLLMEFASPNGTTLNLYIDDLNASEKNNITFEDILGNSRTFAFISTISISINQNLIDDSDVKLIVFFTNDNAGDDLGRDFGTDQAITVEDTSGADMIENDPSASPVDFEYDYDTNVQRGTASAGTDAPVTIVAIGLNIAQYVSTAGTVTRQSTNVFSLVAALERNYST